jgi:hypothetical protein
MGCLCKVNNFLCCISLETGGLIIGWINVIISGIALFFFLTAVILTGIGTNAIDNPSNSVIGGFIGEII